MKKVLLLSMLYCFMCSGSLFAVGLDITEVGLRANGMGTAYTGIADDASAVFWNPAGLAQIEDDNISGEIEVQYLYPTLTFEDSSGKEQDSTKAVVFPVGFVAYKFGDFAVGTGLYVPYATGTIDFNDVPYGAALAGTPFTGTTDLKANSAFYSVGLSVAYQVIPSLSLGITGEAIYGLMDIENNFAITVPVPGSQFTDMHFKGWAGGRYALGAMIKPVDSLNIGLQIKSKTDLKLKGTVYSQTVIPLLAINETVYDKDAAYDEKLPWEFNVGIAYKVTPGLLISIDGAYKMWGSADKKTITSDAFPDGELDASNKEKNNYSSAFGLEDVISDKWKIRGGVFYISSCADDEYVSYLNILDTSVLSVRAGVAYNVLPKLEICADAAYANSLGVFGAENDSGKFGADTWTAVVGIRYSK